MLGQILAGRVLLGSMHRRWLRFVDVVVHVKLLCWYIFLTTLTCFLLVRTVFVFLLADARTNVFIK